MLIQKLINFEKEKMVEHSCTMPPPEDMVVRYIDSGIFVNTRRKIRRFLIVSDTNPRSKSFLKSSAVIRREKARHLQHHYCMIHPFSDARRYLKTYFLIDLLSSLPGDLVLSILGINEKYWFVKLMTCLKLLRITTFLKYLDRLHEMKDYSIYKFKAFKLFLTFFIALLWATSFVYLRARSSSDSWLSQDQRTAYKGLLICCYKSLYNILLVGYGFRPSSEISDMIFSIGCLAIGVVLQIFIYAEILHLYKKNLSAKSKYQQMLYQLHEYIRYKHLPENMSRRILLYFNYRFEKKYYKETEILSTISDNLRNEITLHTCQSLIESVDFFKDLPPALLKRIVKSMKSEIYLTNDVIVRAGISGDSMYFIASGTMAVYTNNGKEICHLPDGSHFGEVALVMDNEKRIASVVAIECCELFNLSRRDYQKAIGPYPDLNQRICQFAQQRLQRTTTFMNEEALQKFQACSGVTARDNHHITF